MKLSEAKQKYMEAQIAYYEGSPIMSDASFDKLEDWIKARSPNWIGLRKAGNNRKVEVKLPQFLPSLNKFYPKRLTNGLINEYCLNGFIWLNWMAILSIWNM